MRRALVKLLQYLHGIFLWTAILSGISEIFSLFEPNQTEVFLRSLVVFVPFFVTGIAAKRVRSIFTFLLISLLSMVPVFLVAATIPQKVVFLLLSFIMMVIRIVARVKDNPLDPLLSPMIGVLAVFVILYIVGTLTHNQLVTTVNYYTGFLYTILIILYQNGIHLNGYLEYNNSVENIPVRQIRKNNTMIMSVFMAVVILMMIFLPMTGMSNLIVLFGKGLRAALIFILGLFTKESAQEVIEETTAPAMEDMAGGFDGLVDETPAWVTALYNSLSLALGVAVGILLFAALITAIYKLIKKFYRPNFENNDEAVFLDPLQGSDDMDRSGRFHRPLWLSFDPNSVIRKQYRKLILKRKKRVDRNSYTPEELENYVELPEDERRARYHGLYEKARYSKDGCTRDDVQALKG